MEKINWAISVKNWPSHKIKIACELRDYCSKIFVYYYTSYNITYNYNNTQK